MKVLRTQRNSKNCVICGMENPLGLKAPFYILDNDSVASVFTFKKEHQSYPDRTHGGMISALLDELIGRDCEKANKIKNAVTYQNSVHNGDNNF